MEQQNLFGEPVPVGKMVKNTTPNRFAITVHKQMLQVHGVMVNTKCKGCIHLAFKRPGKWPKCCLSGATSGGRTSDWSTRWQACGKFEKQE